MTEINRVKMRATFKVYDHATGYREVNDSAELEAYVYLCLLH